MLSELKMRFNRAINILDHVEKSQIFFVDAFLLQNMLSIQRRPALN
jgi:hypothetical protein